MIPMPNMNPKSHEQQYADLCAQVGDLRYKIHCHEMDIENLMKQIYDLNIGFHTKQKVLAEAKAEEEAKKKEEESACSEGCEKI